jgi:hypothetical protein
MYMTTESERITRLEAKLDGFIEETRGRFNGVDSRLNSMESRMNVQLQLTVAMWVTTMLAVLGTLAAVLVRG